MHHNYLRAHLFRAVHASSCFFPIQNALLAVQGLGLETCWVEGYVTDTDNIGRKMADLLGVPENIDLVCYLPIGYAAEEGSRAQKMPFEERAWFNGYRK